MQAKDCAGCGELGRLASKILGPVPLTDTEKRLIAVALVAVEKAAAADKATELLFRLLHPNVPDGHPAQG